MLMKPRYLLVAVILLTFVGCSKNHYFPIEEIPTPSLNKISGLTLNDSTEVEFNRTGGSYNAKKNSIEGTTEKNVNTRHKISEIEFVKVQNKKDDSLGSNIVASKYKLLADAELKNQKNYNVSAVIKNDGREIKFKGGNGEIDYNQQTISGRDKNHKLHVLKFDEVVKVGVSKPAQASAAQTILFVTAVGVVGLVLYFASTYEGYSGFGN